MLVHSAEHASHVRWQLVTRLVRLARHCSMSSPASGVSRCRANLDSLRRARGGVVDVSRRP